MFARDTQDLEFFTPKHNLISEHKTEIINEMSHCTYYSRHYIFENSQTVTNLVSQYCFRYDQ